MHLFKTLSKWEKLSVVLAILFLIGSGFLLSSKPSITGFVPAKYAIKDLEVIILKNQTYVLSAKDSSPLALLNVLVSGKVIGGGEAKIFLLAGEKRLLVYSNRAREKALVSITGFAIKETDKPQELEVDFVPKAEQNILPEIQDADEIDNKEMKAFSELLKNELNNENKKVLIDFIRQTDGIEFHTECVETCSLFGLNETEYQFEFEVDPETVLLVDEIIYSIETGKDI